MEIQEIHQKLEKQCASDYRINEIILFAYHQTELVYLYAKLTDMRCV